MGDLISTIFLPMKIYFLKFLRCSFEYWFMQLVLGDVVILAISRPSLRPNGKILIDEILLWCRVLRFGMCTVVYKIKIQNGAD
jgi:hypothetical protein